jgi:hypothetical protein
MCIGIVILLLLGSGCTSTPPPQDAPVNGVYEYHELIGDQFGQSPLGVSVYSICDDGVVIYTVSDYDGVGAWGTDNATIVAKYCECKTDR